MLKKYSAYVLCLLISILVVTLYLNGFSPLVRMEWKIQDLMYSFRGEENHSSDIVLINIDNKALNKYGEWPWHRDKVADLLAAVGSAEPKTILLDMAFDPDIFEDTSGNTQILAGQMSWIKNVVLVYEYSPADFMSQKVTAPKYLSHSSINVNNDVGILDQSMSHLAKKIYLPPDQMSQFAAGLGFRRNVFDADRKMRWEPLVMNYEGYYYPSASLLTAAIYRGINPSDITVIGGEKIKMGPIEIPTDKRGQIFINYNKPGRSFTEISAADILNETYNIDNLAGRLVIISATADNIMEKFNTPVSGSLRSVEKTANAIENIVNSNYIRRLDSTPGRDVIILILLGTTFAFILPRVSLMYRFIILFGSLFVLANINFVMFNSYNILGRPLHLGLEIFLLLLACPFLDNELLAKLSTLRIGFAPPENTELPKAEMPESQSTTPRRGIKTPREKSAPTVQMTPPKGTNQQIEKTKGLDSSDREQAEMATRMNTPSGGTDATTAAGTPVPPVHKQSDSGSVADGAPSPPPEKEFNADDSSDLMMDSQQIKKLGRYEISGKLGKGAMGMVYKGIDPAINRNVALKTIRLDFVNDPAELKELRERLSTEARAAGNMSHPNIVTIYDVGAEGSLQYIAMEYLEGQTLEDMIRKKTKFNYRIIAQIITQICSALDYAHNQGIVHRDIKPANIMVVKDYNIKVMDFGIARVDTSSMTRTGVAMGTPNYISPELLQGKPVDRRCDIFSLGVVIYELLLNRRPFRGENLTSLIYAIVNSEPEPPTTVDKSIPHLFDRVIAKALAKNPNERFQTAGELALSIKDFIESFSSKSPTV